MENNDIKHKLNLVLEVYKYERNNEDMCDAFLFEQATIAAREVLIKHDNIRVKYNIKNYIVNTYKHRFLKILRSKLFSKKDEVLTDEEAEQFGQIIKEIEEKFAEIEKKYEKIIRDSTR